MYSKQWMGYACEYVPLPGSTMTELERQFIEQLRTVAAELKPFTASAGPGSLVWNGSEYVGGETKVLDPYALVWWSQLNTIADLLEAQSASITERQLSYLKGELFGGMGSFIDFSLDKTLNETAKAANQRIDDKRSLLHQYLIALEQA